MLWRFVIPLISLIGISIGAWAAGGNSSGGGDDLAFSFQESAVAGFHDLQFLKQSGIAPFTSLDLTTLEPYLTQAKVLIEDAELDVELNGKTQTSTARNTPSSGLIELNRSRWSAIARERIRRALALHEMLSLEGIEATASYPISAAYLSYYDYSCGADLCDQEAGSLLHTTDDCALGFCKGDAVAFQNGGDFSEDEIADVFPADQEVYLKNTGKYEIKNLIGTQKGCEGHFCLGSYATREYVDRYSKTPLAVSLKILLIFSNGLLKTEPYGTTDPKYVKLYFPSQLSGYEIPSDGGWKKGDLAGTLPSASYNYFDFSPILAIFSDHWALMPDSRSIPAMNSDLMQTDLLIPPSQEENCSEDNLCKDDLVYSNRGNEYLNPVERVLGVVGDWVHVMAADGSTDSYVVKRSEVIGKGTRLDSPPLVLVSNVGPYSIASEDILFPDGAAALNIPPIDIYPEYVTKSHIAPTREYVVSPQYWSPEVSSFKKIKRGATLYNCWAYPKEKVKVAHLFKNGMFAISSRAVEGDPEGWHYTIEDLSNYKAHCTDNSTP